MCGVSRVFVAQQPARRARQHRGHSCCRFVLLFVCLLCLWVGGCVFVFLDFCECHCFLPVANNRGLEYVSAASEELTAFFQTLTDAPMNATFGLLRFSRNQRTEVN